VDQQALDDARDRRRIARDRRELRPEAGQVRENARDGVARQERRRRHPSGPGAAAAPPPLGAPRRAAAGLPEAEARCGVRCAILFLFLQRIGVTISATTDFIIDIPHATSRYCLANAMDMSI
jgi:hypothetical protein